MDWSPDGKSIAVYVQRRADRVLQLGILNVANGTLQGSGTLPDHAAA
jgi:hypothetical protein